MQLAFIFILTYLGGMFVEFQPLSTQVQQQARCGACWSFAANGAVEGAWKVGKSMKQGEKKDGTEGWERNVLTLSPILRRAFSRESFFEIKCQNFDG